MERPGRDGEVTSPNNSEVSAPSSELRGLHHLARTATITNNHNHNHNQNDSKTKNGLVIITPRGFLRGKSFEGSERTTPSQPLDECR